MASYYVRSGAAGAGTGADWANAYTTLAAAFSGKAAGDVFYVSEDHVESSGSNITLGSAGSLSSPVQVLCVNHSGSVPPVAADLRTTATISTTGNASITLTSLGSYYYGIVFTAGNSTGAPAINLLGANNSSIVLEACALRVGSTGGAAIAIGNSGSSQACHVHLKNTTCQFAAVGQSLLITGSLLWENTASALTGATIPSTLFTFSAGRGGRIVCKGVDLSAVGSGKTLVGNTSGATAIDCDFIDCKIAAAVTIAAAPPAHGAIYIDAVRVGASGVNYNQYRGRYSGTLVEETTIVRTGGASNGATTISWKVVTTANSTWVFPFNCPPIAIWNSTSGSSVTVTIEGIWGGGAVPNDEDIWVEVEYLGASGSPLGSFVNDSKATILTATAGQTSSSETWGGSTTKFKLSVSFTPQQAGWIQATVKCAKASSTFYIDPKITLS